MAPIRWGVLGAANFAREHMAPAIHAAEGAELHALATSSRAKAAPFAAFAPGLRVHDSYDALLADPDIDAVYVPLPNHLHVEWTIKALEAGKHVLCEKPIGLRAADFDRLIAARDASGLLAAEAYMIVHHPQFQRARDLVASGAIGALRHVDASFTFYNNDTANIRNQADTGGGGLSDIGVYTLGGTRFVTGQEPQEITHAEIDTENGVDIYAQSTARFSTFTLSSMVSIRMFKRQRMTFQGDKGVLTLTCPFNANVHDQAELVLETEANSVTIERFPGVNQYVLQVEAFGRALRGEETYPCPLEFSRGTQVMIDMIRKAAA